MPGFTVGPEAGLGVETSLKPYYSYTWDIPHLFGEDALSGCTIFVKDCVFPTFTVNKEEVEGASVIYKYASMINWDDVRISFYDIPRDTSTEMGRSSLFKVLDKWRDTVWTPDGGLKYADGDNGYKKDTKLRAFTLDVSRGYEWTLKGSWPQTVRESDLTYTRSEVKFVEVVIAYDWAVVEAMKHGDLYDMRGMR